MKNQSVELVIEVFLAAKRTRNLEGEILAALRNQIMQEIEGMMQDLGIPAEVSFSLVRKKGQDPMVIMLINGILCRLPFDSRFPGPIGIEWHKNLIIYGILLNRKKLITAKQAQTIRENWSTKINQRYLSNLSGREFCDFLQLLIQHGFRIDRGDHLNQFDFPSNARLAFENAVKEVKNLQIILFIPREKRSAGRQSQLKSFQDEFSLMQDTLFFELGVRIPMVKLKEDESLGKSNYRIQINDLRYQVFQGLEDDEFLVKAKADKLKKYNAESRPIVHPEGSLIYQIVKETGEINKTLKSSGFETWDSKAYVKQYLMTLIRKQADNFLTWESLEYELGFLNQSFPDLINAFVEKYQTDFLLGVLREILKEEISIRNLKEILETILGVKTSISAKFTEKVIIVSSPYMPLFSTEESTSPDPPSPSQFAEMFRVSQKRYLSQKFTKAKGTLYAFLIDPGLEKLFLASDLKALTEEKKLEIHIAIAKEINRTQNHHPFSIFLTSIEIRKRLKKLISIEFPEIHVLSYLELSPDAKIKVLGRISLSE